MPLFKVWTCDRKTRTFVKANGLEELSKRLDPNAVLFRKRLDNIGFSLLQ
jgi:hypothetical protein